MTLVLICFYFVFCFLFFVCLFLFLFCMFYFARHSLGGLDFAEGGFCSRDSTESVDAMANLFLIFCLFFKLEHMPASEQVICAFAQFLSRSFRCTSSIRNYINGVRILHLLNGFSVGWLNDFGLKLLLRCLDRLHPHRVSRQRQ